MKTLFILPNRRVPFTAKQYLAENEARTNRAACARVDFHDAVLRLLCYALVTIVATAAGCVALLFA